MMYPTIQVTESKWDPVKPERMKMPRCRRRVCNHTLAFWRRAKNGLPRSLWLSTPIQANPIPVLSEYTNAQVFSLNYQSKPPKCKSGLLPPCPCPAIHECRSMPNAQLHRALRRVERPLDPKAGRRPSGRFTLLRALSLRTLGEQSEKSRITHQRFRGKVAVAQKRAKEGLPPCT